VNRLARVGLFIAIALTMAPAATPVGTAGPDDKDKKVEVAPLPRPGTNTATGLGAEGEFTPALERTTLRVTDRTVKPAAVVPAVIGQSHPAGDLRVVMGETDIRAFRAGKDAAVWTSDVPADTALIWLASDEQAIYLAGFQTDKKSGRYRPESPARVRRLEPTTGKWLADLELDARPGEGVEAVLTGNGTVMGLTISDDEPRRKEADKPGGHRVSAFDAGATKARWSKSFASAGALARPGVMLLAASRMPDKVRPAVQTLSWLGKDLLVSAGPVQDLLCLAADTGEPRWRVPRVWEFERGFIGPSVCQHFIERSGGEDEDGKEKKKENAPVKPARRNAIVGGPVVVKAEGGREPDRRVFVAVAKGPAHFGEYLSECVVYELGARGKPVGMVTLPRMIRGDAYRILDGGVVWACQGGGFVRLAASAHNGDMLRFGPGGPDLLCTVDWFRQLRPEHPEAWLSSDPAGDPVAFGDRVAFRVRTGGYVPDPAAGVFHFPIAVVDLETGAARPVELRVPFIGKLPEPKSNVSYSNPGGKDRWQTLGPYKMAVTGLEVRGKRLRVTIGTESGAGAVEFDLDEVTASK
jgi:hypothetical protein